MENKINGRCIAIINGITYNLKMLVATPNHPNGGQFYTWAAIQTNYPYEVHFITEYQGMYLVDPRVLCKADKATIENMEKESKTLKMVIYESKI